jgi:hypothetical protein
MEMENRALHEKKTRSLALSLSRWHTVINLDQCLLDVAVQFLHLPQLRWQMLALRSLDVQHKLAWP